MTTASRKRKVPPSISRVYANVNVERPPDYWDYENFQVKWGYDFFFVLLLLFLSKLFSSLCQTALDKMIMKLFERLAVENIVKFLKEST